ncbi:3-deoxy-D-manno-octulosonic acid transferase [Thiohalorhabdus sp. Cl-TMA]|uniref:3-deoxy-D-manno-octulosonic acid transferase n=1 Tax=Thiohalorhabdus methylotrophus TaxID=3242694 RepID=A0ABV4TWB1_9GAMM
MRPDIYRVVTSLAAPPATGYLLWRTVRDNRGGRYFRQRLGWSLPEGPFDFWVHCVSVGEVWAACSLVQALASAHPRRRILVSTCTPTGAETAEKRLPSGTRHTYLPVDFRGAVHRFFRRAQPRCALVVETELWPNLFKACRERDIPLFVINGRLSRRTLEAPAWIRAVLAAALGAVHGCLARSQEDGRRFHALGMPPERIRVLGNLKFARAGELAREVPEASPVARPYVLAGSTHAGEEAALADLWLRAAPTDRLLVIAPRHPARGTRILHELQARTSRVAVRSRGDPITADTAIYLADTLGELTWFLGHADLVFLGGSLVPIGGHNLLEPAALGRPVLVGPHMEKFRGELEGLQGAGGAIQVSGAPELAEELAALLRDPRRRAAIGAAGHRFVHDHGNVLERYLETLAELCPEHFTPGPIRTSASRGSDPAAQAYRLQGGHP